jgi:hypothetical protein
MCALAQDFLQEHTVRKVWRLLRNRLRTTQIKLNVSRNFTEMELRKLFRENIEE